MSVRDERLDELLASAERMAGGDVEHRAAISPAHDEIDALAHALNVVVGELRYSSDQLARTKEQSAARERLAAVGQLAGGVAHQIRNPLAIILNATSVLARSLPDERAPTVDGALAIIREEVNRANAIVTALLDYARRRPLARARVIATSLVEAVLLDASLPPTVVVHRAFEEGIPVVDADEEQLHEALSKLVANAVEAMPNGGNLVIEVATRETSLVIGVVDDGAGIAAAVEPILFEPLQSTKPLGVALGLLAARAIVEAHGGALVAVARDVGARFEIRLPLSEG